jgi:hypothetical protein
VVVDVALDLLEEDLHLTPIQFEGDSVIGDRQSRGDQQWTSNVDGGGSFSWRPRYTDIDNMLELLFGNTALTYHVPILNQTELGTATIEINKAAQNNIQLAGCKFNSIEFKSEGNGALICAAEVLAMTGTKDTTLQTPNYAFLAANPPFLHKNLSIDATGHAWLGGATGPSCREIHFTISNNLIGDAFTNAEGRDLIPEGVFSVEGGMTIPYNSTTKAFYADLLASNMVSFTAEFSDGTHTLEFIFNVKLFGDLPKIGAREVQWLELEFKGKVDTVDTYAVQAKIS